MSWQGQNIKTIAKEKSLTLTRVAELVGVSRQAINDWMNGQIPSGSHLVRLCKVLEIPADALFVPEADSHTTILDQVLKAAKNNEIFRRQIESITSIYEIFFRQASGPGLVQNLRACNTTNKEVLRGAKALRCLSGLTGDEPMEFDHIFTLMEKLGINLIFTEFKKTIDRHSFGANINNHRVVFVDLDVRVLDLVSVILWEAIHAIRDENNVYCPYNAFDKDEESFCDSVATNTQLTDTYILFLSNLINGYDLKAMLLILEKFALKNNHTTYDVQKRITQHTANIIKTSDCNDENIREKTKTAREYFFKHNNARDYVRKLRYTSSVFVRNLSEQIDAISPRKLCELLCIDSELDAIEIRSELKIP